MENKPFIQIGIVAGSKPNAFGLEIVMFLLQSQPPISTYRQIDQKIKWLLKG